MHIPTRGVRQKILAGQPTWIDRHPRAPYLRMLYLATPDWLDRKALRDRYRGKPQHLVGDHIVPLTHPLVCGLNVPWNIRFITPRENAQRANRWWEYTPDLWADPEQLRLWNHL